MDMEDYFNTMKTPMFFVAKTVTEPITIKGISYGKNNFIRLGKTAEQEYQCY